MLLWLQRPQVKQFRLFVLEQVKQQPLTLQFDEHHPIDVVLGQLFGPSVLIDQPQVVSGVLLQPLYSVAVEDGVVDSLSSTALVC